MKILLGSIACLALLATILPAILIFFGKIELETHRNIMAVGMVVWFLTAPFYAKKRNS